MIGLCNVLALDGADKGVKCNIILPSAVTRWRRSGDVRRSAIGAGAGRAGRGAAGARILCVSGEMLTALGGRMARADVVETPGVFRKEWTIEQVAGEMERIRHGGEPLVLLVAPSDFYDHLKYSFEMARAGRRA